MARTDLVVNHASSISVGTANQSPRESNPVSASRIEVRPEIPKCAAETTPPKPRQKIAPRRAWRGRETGRLRLTPASVALTRASGDTPEKSGRLADDPVGCEPSRRLETGKIQGIFQKNGSRGGNPRGFIVAKSAICLTNSLLAGTGNSPAPIRENPGSIREAGGAFQRICCEWAFIVVRDKPDP
jgi:hypothetical protein